MNVQTPFSEECVIYAAGNAYFFGHGGFG
jgi:hypothetical protein